MSNNQTTAGVIHGKEAFIANMSKRLGRSNGVPQSPPERPFRGVPEHYRDIKLTQEENIQLFIQNWTALSGKVIVTKEEDAKQTIQAYVLDVMAELEATKAVCWDHAKLNELELDELLASEGKSMLPWRELEEDGAPATAANTNWSTRSALLKSAERCELGVVWADYAIANTSTLALMARGGHGRSVSLLPPALLAVFHAKTLYTRMGEVFANLSTDTLPSSLNFITGPSRSADIENDLTIGVHGPGKVYAIIIE